MPSSSCRRTLTNDLAQDRTGSCPVHAPARRPRRRRSSTTSSCGGTRDDARCVRRDAERFQHQRCADRDRRGRHHAHRERSSPSRVPTPSATRDGGLPRGGSGRSVPRRHRSMERGRLCTSPAPATRARPASRSPYRPSTLPALWRALATAGIAPAGLGARDTLRLEAALPLHGHELGPGITSLQAGLGWVVAWDKPTFVGRDAAIAERERGIDSSAGRHRHRGAPARRGPAARCSSTVRPSGVVTSGNFSPVLGHGIALAFLPPDTAVGHSGHRSTSAARSSPAPSPPRPSSRADAPPPAPPRAMSEGTGMRSVRSSQRNRRVR